MIRKLFVPVLVAGIVFGGSKKVAPDITNAKTEWVDVIVDFTKIPSEAQHAKIKAKGGQLNTTLDQYHGAAYHMRAQDVDDLAKDVDVVYISPDRPITSTGTAYNGAPADYGWQTVRAQLAQSMYGVDGTGIGVAILDSGIDDREDLKDQNGHSRIIYKTSVVPGVNDPKDEYGHGNHVAGILAGTGKKSTGGKFDYLIRGVAPNANIISIRVLDKNGAGTDSTVILGIQKAIALKNTYNIRVMNVSLGRPVTATCANDPLCEAVQQAWQAGIVVVVAAGNDGRNNTAGTDGYGTITVPGNNPAVITVGAMNTVGTASRSDDKIASYTSKGPTLYDHTVKPDLVAPGNQIMSLRDAGSYLDNTYQENRVPVLAYSTESSNSTPDYFVMSGTSMATPMVSGAAALMIQKDPTLTPDMIKARLMKSAIKFAPGYSYATDPNTGMRYTNEYDAFTVGAGYLDIPAALSNNDRLTGPATSPSARLDPLNHAVYMVGADSAVWGSGTVWGTSAVWGSGTVWGSSAVWGSGAVWGNGAVWGTGTVWNTGAPFSLSAVWGSGAVWGNSAVWGSSDNQALASIAMNGDR